METENSNIMLRRAFEKDDVVAPNKVIRRLQDKIENPDALQGGPAAAVPIPPVPAAAPAPAVHPAPPTSLHLPHGCDDGAAPLLDGAEIPATQSESRFSDSCPRPRKRRRRFTQNPRQWPNLLAAARPILRKVYGIRF